MRATGMPVWIAMMVAWQAPRTVSNEQAAAAIVSGMPRSLMVSSEMMPSVPSAPMKRCVRS